MGFKGLSSVIAPPNAPKADLLALTGGYRRALKRFDINLRHIRQP